jgi:hypothetical protein
MTGTTTSIVPGVARKPVAQLAEWQQGNAEEDQ